LLQEAAIGALEEVVCKERVLTAPELLKPYLWGDIPLNIGVAAAVVPNNIEEIQGIVRVANELGIGLYPISTGNNWGYGAARPVTENNVIVDLRKMNRIIEVNAELAYAVIEPGVTQYQLYKHLEDNKIPLIIDPTGAGPNCSIMGNMLERGYGITPYGDHFLSQCGMEVILANGEILQTGFGHYKNAKATYTFKWGVGPYLDGIFTQSNFGIVTKIGVWLMPKPEYFEACYFMIDDDKDVGELIDAVRMMLLHGIVRSSINLLHRNRMLTVLTGYPWLEMEGKVPMSDEVAVKLAKEKKIGAWNGVAALYGTKKQVKAAKSRIKKLLSGKTSRLTFVSGLTLKFLERFKGLFSILSGLNIREIIKAVKPSYYILQGVPNEVALSTPYWRMKKRPSVIQGINPAQDNCGVIWLSPVIPMTKENVDEFRGAVEPIFRRHGFDCCITLTTVTHRCFDCTIPILYDRNNPDDTANADACYHELLKTCMEKGYIPYRFGIQSMAEITGRKDTFWDTVDKIKKALDPHGILSPGRYSR
jgi:4-cresol dehydrogenase (hydroxylating)